MDDNRGAMRVLDGQDADDEVTGANVVSYYSRNYLQGIPRSREYRSLPPKRGRANLENAARRIRLPHRRPLRLQATIHNFQSRHGSLHGRTHRSSLCH